MHEWPQAVGQLRNRTRKDRRHGCATNEEQKEQVGGSPRKACSTCFNCLRCGMPISSKLKQSMLERVCLRFRMEATPKSHAGLGSLMTQLLLRHPCSSSIPGPHPQHPLAHLVGVWWNPTLICCELMNRHWLTSPQENS